MEDKTRNRWFMSFGGSLNVLIGLATLTYDERLSLVAWPFIIGGLLMKATSFMEAISQGTRRGE